MEKTTEHKPTYNRYEWQAGSPIKAMAVRKDQTYPTAYIEASADAADSLYTQLPKLLSQRGLLFFADELDGKQVLRVWGFDKESDIHAVLERSGYVNGTGTQTEVAPEKKTDGPMGWVRKNSVVAAGLGYLTGDLLLMASGQVRKDASQTIGSMKFAVTSALLILLGNKNPRTQLDHLYKKMDNYLEKSDIDLSNTDHHVLSRLHKNVDNVSSDVEHLLSEHVITLNNTLFGWGGLNMARAGMTGKGNLGGKPNPFKALTGSSYTLGYWGAEIIPEDEDAGMTREEVKAKEQAKREDKEFKPAPIDPFVDPWSWLKRKPLRLASVSAITGNLSLLVGGFGYELPEMRKKLGELVKGTEEYKKTSAYLQGSFFDGLTPLAYITGGAIYGMSPKDRRGFLREDDYLGELYTVAAHLFSGFPEEERTVRIAQFAGNMASHDEMKSTAEEIQAHIEQKIAQIETSPWHIGMVKDRPEYRAHANASAHEGVLAEPEKLAALTH